ncbi:15381_t:CDS:2, partial [Dentiscutata heterogama]
MPINFEENIPSIMLQQVCRPRKQVDEISLAAASSNFRVAKDVVDYNLLDDEISNL